PPLAVRKFDSNHDTRKTDRVSTGPPEPGYAWNKFGLRRDSTSMKITRTAWLLAVAFAAAAQLPPGSKPPGPEIGTKIPAFRLVDQNGHERTFESILGPRGAMLVFYRSADW